jgi:hypothetical protein
MIVFKAGAICADLFGAFHKSPEFSPTVAARDLVRAVLIVKRLAVFAPDDSGATPCTEMLDHIFIVDVHVLLLPTPIPRSPVDGFIVHPGSAYITNDDITDCSILAFYVFNAHNTVFAPVFRPYLACL